MDNYQKVKDVYVDILSQSTGKGREEVLQHLEKNMHDVLGVTSVELFPLLSGLEETFGIELDYADFITNVESAKDGIEFVLKTIGEN